MSKEAHMAAWAEGELHHDPDADVSEEAYDRAMSDEHGAEIDAHRTSMLLALGTAEDAIVDLRRTFDRLASERLYDVEVVEGPASRTVPYLLTQIDAAIAALHHVLPEPGR